ncbi:hypothetical protein Tco_0217664 [Tanacetum coccineum]
MSTSTNTTFEFYVNHNGELKLNPLTYQDGSILNINVPAMDFKDMVSYLTRKITKRFTTLYYTLPPNHTFIGMNAIKNDYDTNVMYDIAKVAGKLQIYASHHPIDLSTVLIPNDGSLENSFACIIFEETILKQKESLRVDERREVTQNDYTFDQMVEWAEQEHFEDEETKDVQRQKTTWKNPHDEESCLEEQMLNLMHRFTNRFTRRRPEVNRLMTLPDHPLIDYDRYTLERMTGADMRNATTLKMARDELPRSMEEKAEFIKNYKEM